MTTPIAPKPTPFAESIDRAHKRLSWSLFGYKDPEVGYSVDHVRQGATAASQYLAEALKVGGPQPAVTHATRGQELIKQGLAAKTDTETIDILSAASQSVWSAWRDSAK